MERITENYVKFVTDLTWEDLPQNVVREIKRATLDSIGCAVAGLATDKAKLAVELAVRQGGPAQASILGLGARVSIANAAFANGETISSLDYDGSLNGHTFPIVIPAALATAESMGACGRDLIVALAAGLEGAARMQQSLARNLELVREGPDKGKTMEWPAFGYSAAIFGATAAASRLLCLDREQTLNAMGISGYIAPVPAMGKWYKTPRSPMTKYCMGGWIAQAAVTAASLAELGYTGDQTVLDGDYGFWRFYLPYKWNPDVLLGGLGKEWFIPKAYYKPYPCTRVWHALLDGFIHIIETNGLGPEDIDAVKLFARKENAQPVLLNRDIRTQTDAQFSGAYVIAAAAHRIKLLDWQDFDTMRSPGIVSFMDKVSLNVYPDWAQTALEVPGSDPAAVEVVSRGRVYREDRRFAKGGGRVNIGGTRGGVPEDVVMTDEDLVKKFRDNVSRGLPQSRIGRIVESLMGLEQVTNVCEVVDDIRL